MAQMIGRRPFGKLDRRDQARFEPPTLAHIFGGQAFAPPALPAFGQIFERTPSAIESTESPEQRRSGRRRESVSNSRHIDQLLAFVIADHNRVEVLRCRHIAADDQLLSLVNPHLNPRARSSSGLVRAAAAFRDHALQTLLAYRSNKFRCGGGNRFRKADWFLPPRAHSRMQRPTAKRQGFVPEILADKNQEVKKIKQNAVLGSR